MRCCLLLFNVAVFMLPALQVAAMPNGTVVIEGDDNERLVIRASGLIEVELSPVFRDVIVS